MRARASAPRAARFTTQESVEDIEALRQAAGYEKLVLYGTSYGTKVALEYAERYPQHVEALVLDSVVPADGPEPFALPTFQAIAPVLDELCCERRLRRHHRQPARRPRAAGRAAAHATRCSGSVYDGAGHRHAVTLSEVGLLDILEAGDLNPALRALLPAAVRSALRSDPDPLLRLQPALGGADPERARRSRRGRRQLARRSTKRCSSTTTCEETPFPWQRAAPPAHAARRSARLPARPAGARLLPVRRGRTALDNSLIPTAPRGRRLAGAAGRRRPLPNVPTLILSGAQDLRTPDRQRARASPR